ncbi:MAG: transporter substrate-binding domain-containing protein [Desulfobulbus sp.]|nr:transporter substrate-binding domain-containing protein [Desulfobulbus sp.]
MAGYELRVGIRDIKPFIFLEPNQEPSGYAIDLWQAIAADLGLPYRFVPSQGIAQTLQDMESGKLDIAIGAITITENRESQFDFGLSHFHTGLGIMTSAKNSYSFSAFRASFFTQERIIKIGSFVAFLLLSAHVIWLAERRNQHTFHRNYFPGILEGIYWSIVTASTVGYGDYIPKSRVGKTLAVLIIIVSLPMFAVFVANISSDFALHEFRSYIHGPKDLIGKKVGVIKGSVSEEYMHRENLGVLTIVPSAKDMYALLEEKKLDAVVHDLPSLQYYANTAGQGKVKLVGKMFDKQDYAFLLPENSRLKEQIDRCLLKLFENGTMDKLNNTWFGTGTEQ